MRPLSFYSVRYLRERGLRLPHPILLWRSAPTEKPSVVWKTQAPILKPRPIAGDPVVLEILKGSHSGNAFPMGVTLGRTDSNDICLEDESVSRFHAYFQQSDGQGEAPGVWTVADADSRNGSRLNGAPLAPRHPRPVADGDRIVFGDVDLYFHDAEGFERLLASLKRPGE